MNPHPPADELMAFRDGELSPAQRTDVAAHVDVCLECRATLNGFEAVSARLQQWPVDATPASLQRPVATAPTKSTRPYYYWAAAAAVLLIVGAATVRVECAPACDPRTVHFALPGHAPSAAQTPPADQGAINAEAFTRDWMARPRFPTPSAPGAKVTVVIFLDWQCPGCRTAERAYAPVFADFERSAPGAVQVVVKDYPLNMRCNPYVPVEMHTAACEAAVAVRLAGARGTSDAMIDWLFANQETLTPDGVRGAAATIGKIPDFDAQMTAVLDDIRADVALAHALEVSSTPTCFINGVLARGEGGRTLFRAEEVRLAIEAELARVK